MAAEHEETGYFPGTPGKLRLDPGGEKPSESTGNANYVKRGRSLLRIVWHVSNRNRANGERECRRQGTDFPIVVLSIFVPEIRQHLWFLLFRVCSNFDFFMHHSFHTFVIQFYAGRTKEKLSGSCRNDEVRNR